MDSDKNIPAFYIYYVTLLEKSVTGVQLCRPSDQIFDNYNPCKIGQTNADYYIHEKSGWTDELIKMFRKNVRSQNICIRQELPFYSILLIMSIKGLIKNL
ncbi:hypothetical protein AMJ80_07520 [bacterium SM23_31]|nr:MAG: hypothetical protein AMJ80_07520 [bacterium SM23_31]